MIAIVGFFRLNFFFCLFFSNFGGHKSLLWGHCYPCLDFWWCLTRASKPEWTALFALRRGYVLHIPWHSPLCVTPADLTWWPAWRPSCPLSHPLWAGIDRVQNWDLLCPRWMPAMLSRLDQKCSDDYVYWRIHFNTRSEVQSKRICIILFCFTSL